MIYDTNVAQDAPVLEDNQPGVGSDDKGGNDNDPILKDITTILGSDPSADASDDKPLERDRFEPKDPQALLRKLQSERDTEKSARVKYENELKEYKPIAEFMTSLYDDAEAREAFIGELAPDLLKPKDPLTFIQEGLKKEFGEDFTPKNEEANVLGSKSWLYNEMAKDLLVKWREKRNNSPKNLKDLTDRRRAAKAAAEKSFKDEKESVMKDWGWNEALYQEFATWGSKISQKHLAPIFAKAKGFKKGANPLTPASIPGGRTIVDSKMKQELDSIFGAN